MKLENFWYKLVAPSLVEKLRVMTDNYNTILNEYCTLNNKNEALLKSNTFLSMNQKEQLDPALKCVAVSSSNASLQTIRDLEQQLKNAREIANRRLIELESIRKTEWRSDCGAS